MGLFRKDQPPAVSTPSTQSAQDMIRARTAWRCISEQVQTAPVTTMRDDTAIGERAYGVTFARDDVPGSSITLWFYAATGYPFLTRYRYDRLTAGPQWTGFGWGNYGKWENQAEADEGARELAEAHLIHPWLTLATEYGGLFCWGGVL